MVVCHFERRYLQGTAWNPRKRKRGKYSFEEQWTWPKRYQTEIKLKIYLYAVFNLLTNSCYNTIVIGNNVIVSICIGRMQNHSNQLWRLRKFLHVWDTINSSKFLCSRSTGWIKRGFSHLWDWNQISDATLLNEELVSWNYRRLIQ